METTEIQKYERNLMEIKRRVDVIKVYLKGEKTTGFLITEVEFLAIQFRKIIELIAFSSLIVNKNEYAAFRATLKQDFKTDWNAKRIFAALEKINPHFYPEPSKQIERISQEGKQFVELQKINVGFLTKENAIEVYDLCSTVLHEWNPYSEIKDLRSFHNQFKGWLNKIITLLSHHTIFLGPKKTLVAAEMQSRATGQPRAFIFSEMSKAEISNLAPEIKVDLTKLGLDFSKRDK